MMTVRVALANIAFPHDPDASVTQAIDAIADAGARHADIICFPECYVPGYRLMGRRVQLVDAAFLERAWSRIAAAADQAHVTVLLGTERFVSGQLRIAVLVITRDGSIAGFQDKLQLAPPEDGTYSAGETRSVFQAGPVTFGIAICHEGFRYPETVRWAARRGAQIVFHPHFHEGQAGDYQAATFADPDNSFHEKAILCRAAENSCFVATVNCAVPRSQTTSAIVRPDGTLLCYQPYGAAGLLIADLDLSEATGLLASRWKPSA